MGVHGAGTFRSLATRTTGNYVVFVHGSLAPPQSEWQVVLDTYRSHPNIQRVKTLVYTEGGAPSAGQRAELSAVLGKAKVPVAVMTSSTIGRAAGTALSWLIPTFKVFSATDFDGALDHLGASSGDRRTLRDLVEELRRELAGRSGVNAARQG
jgi:hypothetical protein